MSGETAVYYDPYDVTINADPYPTFARLRDEAPLYHNERLDFWGLSRFADVESALKDWRRLSSAKGDILEVVKADPTMPPGVFINEDPPEHTMHRALVSRAFTPGRMKRLEDQIRAFCAACARRSAPCVLCGPSSVTPCSVNRLISGSAWRRPIA